ncbi:tRNA1(Val) (adenine(37)-N6)-methyltransferase [Vagococcus intermedius]|uniref:tRNA1(Val) (Adenine(37)-N6)-methyltransferase n=1 Tax=Vagococcus intermedius TaxID=2991418 RepID=A0AAF0CUN4_9ENTE|nr:tRNA1(Val) (adenine(37)-N6)-methyltransferase [Vagococcus intermedius]WEG73206.1 tRNA1(Val) (adenine(37)-N6)-methyltransferase [Vagococcus intermedius]WEG75291.1 tRNA1(Val) (adenine(37)-N6)-methyltransferase [Vagococcus intermedius]
MSELLYENERIDQLYADDIQIIQSHEVFSFSLDAVLLANFAGLPKRGTIVDLCAGNGAVSLFMSRKTSAHIIGVELQERLADMGRRSIQLNGLESQLSMLTMDLKNVTHAIKKDSVDLVVCNPPYFKELPTNQKNPNPYLAIARHEIKTNLDTVIQESSGLLKFNGKLAIVHRPERLLDILETMKKYHIMPKRVQFVYPKSGKEANILLVEGIRQGKPGGLKILPPLQVYDEQGNYLDAVRSMLYGE